MVALEFIRRPVQKYSLSYAPLKNVNVYFFLGRTLPDRYSLFRMQSENETEITINFLYLKHFEK